MFLLGHSAGGVVSASTRWSTRTQFAGFICESFAYQVPAPDFAIAALKGLSHLAPHAHVLRLKNEDFSRDPAVVQAMDADPLIAHESQPTRAWRAGAGGRPAEARVPAYHPAAADPARHGGPGGEAELAVSSSSTPPGRRTRR